jgi:TonB family protein
MRAQPQPDPSRGSWRYDTHQPRNTYFWVSLIVSGGLHAMVMFGFNEEPAPPPELQINDTIEVVLMEMPPIEELEEPEEVYDPDAEPLEELDASAYVPMQADVPSIATDATFVQKLDVRSLLPRPDFDAAQVVTIPPNVGQGRVQPNQIKDLFDLADLDRVPEAIMQQPPVFPNHLKSEVRYAEVVVDFIVDAKGKVPWTSVHSSTHRGFEDAAVLGVSRWQFRPGMKNGKKVSTRMRVPLKFRVTDD